MFEFFFYQSKGYLIEFDLKILYTINKMNSWMCERLRLSRSSPTDDLIKMLYSNIMERCYTRVLHIEEILISYERGRNIGFLSTTEIKIRPVQ